MVEFRDMQRTHYAKAVEKKKQDASGLSVGVVVSEFNSDITEPMLHEALATLRAWKVKEQNISVVRVPGSFEIPYGCLTLLSAKKKPDAIVTVGCIIKGETEHDRYLAMAVSQAIMRLTIDFTTPISFGIITPNNLAQAKARSRGMGNKGPEAAEAALRLGLLKRKGSPR